MKQAGRRAARQAACRQARHDQPGRQAAQQAVQLEQCTAQSAPNSLPRTAAIVISMPRGRPAPPAPTAAAAARPPAWLSRLVPPLAQRAQRAQQAQPCQPLSGLSAQPQPAAPAGKLPCSWSGAGITQQQRPSSCRAAAVFLQLSRQHHSGPCRGSVASAAGRPPLCRCGACRAAVRSCCWAFCNAAATRQAGSPTRKSQWQSCHKTALAPLGLRVNCRPEAPLQVKVLQRPGRR